MADDDDDDRARPLEPSQSFVPWRVTAPQDEESVRWVCVDGRWVSIGLNRGEHAGRAVVRSSNGEVHYADSYEGALDLARSLRTV